MNLLHPDEQQLRHLSALVGHLAARQEGGTYPFWCTVKRHKAGGMTGTITVTS